MKNILLLLAFMLFAFVSPAQDTIPNSGFENWSTNPNYDNPIGWSSVNQYTFPLNKLVAFKTSASGEVHSGSHAIKLVSKQITSQNFAPAFITTGTVIADPDSGGIFGGIPINSRPTAVTGWHMYFPLGSDKALLEVFLFKQGAEIGSGSITVDDSVTAWTGFSIPITYTSSETPDTALITFFASEGDESPPAEENSTLFIDDVAYSYSTSIERIENDAVLKILPNPASDKIVIETLSRNIERYIIYALDGKMVKEVSATDGITEIKVNDLKVGKYVLSAVSDKGMTSSEVFEIQR